MHMKTRRDFLKTGMLAAGTALITPAWLKNNRVLASTSGSLEFRPYPSPWMPKITWAYAADDFGDPFRSDIRVVKEGIQIPDNFGSRRFSLTTRWYVEDFGYLMLAADNGGELYSKADFKGNTALNLNYEFARTRIVRNRQVCVN